MGGTSKQLPQSWRSTLLRCPSKRGFATGRCASPRPESRSDKHTLSKACRLLLELRNPRQISPQPWKVYPMNLSGICCMDEISLQCNFGGRWKGGSNASDCHLLTPCQAPHDVPAPPTDMDSRAAFSGLGLFRMRMGVRAFGAADR